MGFLHSFKNRIQKYYFNIVQDGVNIISIKATMTSNFLKEISLRPFFIHICL